MADHEHAWEPVPGLWARYRCTSCPATGYRYDGPDVVEHKNPSLQVGALGSQCRITLNTGFKKPSLDDYDKRGRKS